VLNVRKVDRNDREAEGVFLPDERSAIVPAADLRFEDLVRRQRHLHVVVLALAAHGDGDQVAGLLVGEVIVDAGCRRDGLAVDLDDDFALFKTGAVGGLAGSDALDRSADAVGRFDGLQAEHAAFLAELHGPAAGAESDLQSQVFAVA
jgi:hypothetical protein